MITTASATVTGDTGPGGSVTSLVLSQMTDFEFDLAHNMIYIMYGTPTKRFPLSLEGVGTVTVTISGSSLTLTIS